MPKSYEVLERSFINGRLYEAGSRVILEIDSPGSNLKQLTQDQAGTSKPLDQQNVAELRETAAGLSLSIPDGATKADIRKLIEAKQEAAE